MHKLIKNYGQIDITPGVSYIRRRSSRNEISEELDFVFKGSVKINPGNLILLFNDFKELFRGINITDTTSGTQPMEYNCFDYGFYLNKNQEVYQFNTDASTAIRKICNDFKIPVGNIVNISTKIKKIYTGNLSDTIKDILEQAENEKGVKYRFEMREGYFYVEEKINNIIRISTSIFGSDKDLTKFISNPTRVRSIENLKNSIKIVQGGEEKINVITSIQDDSSINLYGKLQEVKSIDEKNISKARNIADNLLKDLNKVIETSTFQLPGHDDCRAGRCLEIIEEVTGLKGIYEITDCTHEIKNSIHKMQLGLEKV